MNARKCIAIVLAGGRGERLGSLANHYSKPVIHFRGSHRIIDFALSSCVESGVDAVAVLSQYFNADLNEYISSAYGESGSRGVHLLSSENESSLYTGTSDAVNATVGNPTVIKDGAVIGADSGEDFFIDRKGCTGDVSLVSPWVNIRGGIGIRKNSYVMKEQLENYYSAWKRSAFHSESTKYAVV